MEEDVTLISRQRGSGYPVSTFYLFYLRVMADSGNSGVVLVVCW